jgi:hypothetical protein
MPKGDVLVDPPDELEMVGFELTLGSGEPGSGDGSTIQSRVAAEPVGEVGERFVARLQLLWTYLNKIGAVAQATSITNMAMLVSLVGQLKGKTRKTGDQSVLATAELRIKAKRSNGDSVENVITVPILDDRTLKTLREHTKYHDAAMRILHETSVQQIVNSFEHLMAGLVRKHIRDNIKAAAADRTITYRELLEYGTLEEAQRRVTEAQVLEFLRNKDFAAQLKYLKSELNVDLRSHFGEVDEFAELVLRRHAIVHADGVATAEYRRHAKKLVNPTDLPAEGARLELTPAYVSSQWDRAYAMGVIVAHLADRSIARARKDKGAEEEADTFLVNAAFWAIQKGRYQCAQRILAYAGQLKLSKDGCDRMVAVNLAQAMKWAGDETGCVRELTKHDWEASSAVFKLVVEVLREGPDVEKLLARAVSDGDIDEYSVYEWPVFQAWRKTTEFADVMKRVFGEGSREPEGEFAASLLDFDYRKTLEKLQRLGRVQVSPATKTPADGDVAPVVGDLNGSKVH